MLDSWLLTWEKDQLVKEQAGRQMLLSKAMAIWVFNVLEALTET